MSELTQERERLAEIWDDFLLEQGPDRVLEEVHILRRALHLLVEELGPSSDRDMQEVIDRHVWAARREIQAR